MVFDVQTGGLDRLERGISPPMQMAITIPVVAGLGARGAEVIVYVATSPFGQRGIGTSARELKAIASEVARRLQQEVA